jgi:hypothetical protein
MLVDNALATYPRLAETTPPARMMQETQR